MHASQGRHTRAQPLEPRLTIALYVTDLILAAVRLLERDISRLVVEARETLELVEPWDKG